MARKSVEHAIDGLTPEQQMQVAQAVSTLRIESMEPSDDAIEMFAMAAAGRKEGSHKLLAELTRKIRRR